MTNTGAGVDTAAGSVLYAYNAGYPVKSRLCQLMVAASDPAAVAGGYCWQPMGTATVFDEPLGRAAPLQPGQPQTAEVEPTAVPGGLSVEAPRAESGSVGRALGRPAIVVVTTSDVRPDSNQAELRHACQTAGDVQPTAPGGAAAPVEMDQHAIISATGPVTCSELPPL